MNIIDRAKNLILQPRAEWEKIDGETHTVQGLYTGWIMILAAIGPVAAFVGHSLVGVGAFGMAYRDPARAFCPTVMAPCAMHCRLSPSIDSALYSCYVIRVKSVGFCFHPYRKLLI